MCCVLWLQFYFKRYHKFIAKWAAIHRISNNILGVAAILIYHNSHWISILRPAAVFPWALIATHQWKTLRKLSQKNWKWPKIEYVCCTEKSNYLISHFHILFVEYHFHIILSSPVLSKIYVFFWQFSMCLFCY